MIRIKLGKFNWEQDRIQAVEESWKRRFGHSGMRIIHSKLTIKGKLRKLFKIKKGEIKELRNNNGR